MTFFSPARGIVSIAIAGLVGLATSSSAAQPRQPRPKAQPPAQPAAQAQAQAQAPAPAAPPAPALPAPATPPSLPTPPPEPELAAAPSEELAALHASLAAANLALADLSTRMRETEKIVEELERKTAQQRLAWSADYRVTLSSFRYSGYALDGSRDADGTPREVTLKNLEQWTHRARLSLQADAGTTLRFRARMVVFKRFGETAAVTIFDGATGRVPRDATVRFDRFWLDWFLTERLSLSVGRISSTDGTPAELRENLDRPAATFTVGLIDREYDAVVMTYQLGPALLRGFYTGWQFQRKEDVTSSLPFLARNSEPVRIYGAGLQLRSSKPRIPSLDLTAYLSPHFRAFPPLDLPQPDGTVISPSKVPSSIGAIGGVTALLLSRDLVKGLDAFAAASFSHLDPNGETIDFPIGPGGASTPVLALASSDADTHIGYQLYGGVRVTSPWGGARAPKLGAEMTYGSRYLVNFATPTSDLLTRLGVRGRTYDAYYIQPIYPSLFARLSWTLLDYEHAPPVGGALGFVAALGGTAPETKRDIMGVNLALHAAF
jgi:Protein of unknown function (DUF3373)